MELLLQIECLWLIKLSEGLKMKQKTHIYLTDLIVRRSYALLYLLVYLYECLHEFIHVNLIHAVPIENR